jgi:hypothetical protein
MTNHTYHKPTDAEMQAYHARAQQLRADAVRDMMKAIGQSLSQAVAFVASALSGRKTTAVK